MASSVYEACETFLRGRYELEFASDPPQLRLRYPFGPHAVIDGIAGRYFALPDGTFILMRGSCLFAVADEAEKQALEEAIPAGPMIANCGNAIFQSFTGVLWTSVTGNRVIAAQYLRHRLALSLAGTVLAGFDLEGNPMGSRRIDDGDAHIHLASVSDAGIFLSLGCNCALSGRRGCMCVGVIYAKFEIQTAVEWIVLDIPEPLVFVPNPFLADSITIQHPSGLTLLIEARGRVTAEFPGSPTLRVFPEIAPSVLEYIERGVLIFPNGALALLMDNQDVTSMIVQ